MGKLLLSLKNRNMNFMTKKCSWCNTDSGLLVLRIGVGAIFVFSGWMKVSNLSQTVGMFASMGFGVMWAYLVSILELVGGIAVLLGAYTRAFSTILAVIMIVAIYVVHSEPSMIMTPISVFFSCVTLALASGGKYSVMNKNL